MAHPEGAGAIERGAGAEAGARGDRGVGAELSVRLEHLGSAHTGAIIAGQDQVLAQEVFGCLWEPDELAEFLARAQRWQPDGPVREFAARPIAAQHADGVVGGGGLHLLGPGLERGQADMSYWVLAPHRGQGWGAAIVRALRETAAMDPRVVTLVLRIASENAASRRVAYGAGARPTGRSERHPGDLARRVERWELALRCQGGACHAAPGGAGCDGADGGAGSGAGCDGAGGRRATLAR